MSDLFDALADLPSLENYTPKDRYRDFRKVFMGSEEGKRTLKEILSWGRMFRPAVVTAPVDPYLTHVREGERNICLKLMHTVYNEPPEPPKTTRKRK